MKYLTFLTTILVSLPSLCWATANAQINKVTFSCDLSAKVPRTVAKTSKKEIYLITWESKAFETSGFTPTRRCQDVSDRLQGFAKDSSLRYITTGKINKENVICVAAYKDGKCRPNGLILTLQKDENPPEVLRALFDTAFKVAGAPPLKRGEKVTVDLEEILNTTP